MQVETFLFGTVNVSPDAVISFPDAIPGFPDSRRYALIHETAGGENPASFTLQSLDEPGVALQIADPTAFGLHYELDLSDAEAAKLKASDATDLALLLVLYKPEAGSTAIRANLQAPLLINTKSRLGMQKVMPKIEPRVTLKGLVTPA